MEEALVVADYRAPDVGWRTTTRRHSRGSTLNAKPIREARSRINVLYLIRHTKGEL